MRLRSLLFCAVLFAAAVPALATPQLRNGNDMWFDPAESGWGMNIFHQGDTLFVSLFVYGPDGQPRWYAASGLVGGDDGPLHDRPATYSGALYEANGPYFGGAFAQNAVTVRQVGTMSIELGYSASYVDYTVDGVRVSKQVRPFGFRPVDLTGVYVGHLYQPATSTGPEIVDAMTMTVQDSGSTIHIATASEHRGACTFDGTRSQAGQLAVASGTFSNCASSGSGPFSMVVDMTPDGFTGSFNGAGITSFWGRVAMSRRTAGLHEGNGWRTDNWFPPNESGWGVNVVEQGDTIFATLFVYDAQHRPRWYVGPALARSGPTSAGTYVFAGALYETTGPYFGTSFNPDAVTKRQVGQMSFEVRADGSALLDYNVDAVAVSKVVNRFGFRKNNMSGSYVGHLAASADDPGGASYEQMTIDVDDTDAGFSMRTQPIGATQFNSGANCTYTAPPVTLSGQESLVSGTFTCVGGRTGAFQMRAFVTFDGFTSTFKGAWVAKGHMQGVRLGAN